MLKRFQSCAIVVAAVFILFCQAAVAYERKSPVVEAVAKAGPAVVNIRTEEIIKRRVTSFFGFADPFFDEFFREFAPPRVSESGGRV